ncbi:MAG: hypothetical protein WCH78_13775 [Bacteroidota bacterium]
MKKIFSLLFILSISIQLFSQVPLFLRVYDHQNAKFSKGNLYATTDSTLTLLGNKLDTMVIPISKIEYIKTRHSFGNSFLVATGALVLGVGVISVITAPTSTNSPVSLQQGLQKAGDFFLTGLLYAGAGTIYGIALGSSAKKIKTFPVYGKKSSWLNAKKVLDTHIYL